jgi:hypothetical protein
MTDRRHPARVPTRWPVLAVALLLGACSGDDAAPSADPVTSGAAPIIGEPATPAWLERVHPEPDAQSAAERAVGVDTRTLEPTEELRLVIDGVDVTAQALAGEPSGGAGGGAGPTFNDRLRYDPRDLTVEPLVPLAPGEHRATVELRRRPGFGEATTLVDAYTWSFTIQ